MKKIFPFLICFCPYLLMSQERNNAFALDGVKWQTNTIEVTWENPTSENAEERTWVKEAIKGTWQKESSIKFTNWGVSNPDSRGVRIKIDDHPEGPHTEGLGNQLDGVPNGMSLNFTFNNWSKAMRNKRKDYIVAIAVHEFGHALGLAHEHNRQDCFFCDKSKQGTDGDYYVTTCDPKSVMNYCNPSYNNWGKLSDGDKKAISILYTPETNNAPSIADNNITIEHTVRDLTEKEVVEWPGLKKFAKVYVKGSTEELALIKNVTYHLHPSFPKPVMTIENSKCNFGLGLFAWGMFELTAVINFKDGTSKTIPHFLDFRDPNYSEELGSIKSGYTPNLSNTGEIVDDGGSGQRTLSPPDLHVNMNSSTEQSTQTIKELEIKPVFEIKQTAKKLSADESKNRGNNSHEIKFMLDAQPSFLDQVAYVEYTLHPTFNNPVRKMTNRKENFQLVFTCWGMFTVKALVVMNDGKEYASEHEIEF